LLDEPGYDPKTGILFDPLGVKFPRVPNLPTKRIAETALGRILRLVETFSFVSEDDKAVALSLIFTAIARRGLPFAPLHAFDAPTAGVGKSMLVDIGSILATGHEAGVVAQGETREESEKRLSAILMRGDPLIAIDNCEVPLEGILLNQMLTQHKVQLRILGLSKMVTAQTTALPTATGNNLIVKGDLTRRAIVGRLDPKVERPELLSFNSDPIAEAKERRGELVIDILTVLTAYHHAGRPNRPKPLQSFTHWSNTVRGSLIWLGCGDPVKTMDRLREHDPILASLKTVLTAWRDQFGDTPATANDAAEAANATTVTADPNSIWRQVRSPTNPVLHDALLIVAGRSGVVDIRVLGQWLGRHADRVVGLGGRDFVAMEMAGTVHGFRRWRVTVRPPTEAGKSE
jgi:hypothetical protein